MKTRILRIGNSQGIRIPKPLIAEAGLIGELEISVVENSLVIKAVAKPRANWADSFREPAKRGDDSLIDEGSAASTSWDEDEWEW